MATMSVCIYIGKPLGVLLYPVIKLKVRGDYRFSGIGDYIILGSVVWEY